jgi:hypothetical protein
MTKTTIPRTGHTDEHTDERKVRVRSAKHSETAGTPQPRLPTADICFRTSRSAANDQPSARPSYKFEGIRL